MQPSPPFCDVSSPFFLQFLIFVQFREGVGRGKGERGVFLVFCMCAFKVGLVNIFTL